MAGTKAGSLKQRMEMIAKFGSEEAYREHMAKIGKKGGQKTGTEGGFASSKVGDDGLTGLQRASIVGAKGGRTSRRKAVK